MPKFLTRHQIALFFFSLLIIGLFTQKFFRILPSIGMLGLLGTALFTKDYKGGFQRFFQDKASWVFSLFFLIFLLSGFQTDRINLSFYETRALQKLPYFLLPLACAFLPKLSKRQFYGLLQVFFWTAVLTSFGALVNFGLHFQEILASYKASKVLPLPVHHPHFSMMVAFAVFVGLFFIQEGIGSKILTGIASLFLVIFLHILAVRIGLLCLYALGIGALLYEAKRRKKLGWGISGMVGILLALGIASQTVPTIKHKIENSLEDLKYYDNPGQGQWYSLSLRLYSYDIGWIIFEEHPVAGVGIGNIERATQKAYIRYLPQVDKNHQALAHNQYIRYLSGFGVVGFIAFLIAYYYPLWCYRKESLLLLLYGALSLIFLVEAPLETQSGTNFSVALITLFIYWLRPENSSKTS